MKSVSIHEAKTHLSRLVKLIRSGAENEIVIAVGGEPAARLISYGAPPKRRLGMDEGLVSIADDFDEPDERIAALFHGAE